MYDHVIFNGNQSSDFKCSMQDLIDFVSLFYPRILSFQSILLNCINFPIGNSQLVEYKFEYFNDIGVVVTNFPCFFKVQNLVFTFFSLNSSLICLKSSCLGFKLEIDLEKATNAVVLEVTSKQALEVVCSEFQISHFSSFNYVNFDTCENFTLRINVELQQQKECALVLPDCIFKLTVNSSGRCFRLNDMLIQYPIEFKY